LLYANIFADTGNRVKQIRGFIFANRGSLLSGLGFYKSGRRL